MSQEIERDLQIRGFDTFKGSVKYAPFGTISNPSGANIPKFHPMLLPQAPSGTYGAIFLSDKDAAYPEQTFCTCISGNTTVDPICSNLNKPLFSSQLEGACTGSFVLNPSDAVILIGCTPPEGKNLGKSIIFVMYQHAH